MGNKRLPVLAILTLANFLSGNPALASPAPQSKRSKSDADINAIGHRKIAHDPNFYSPEHEKDLGKTQSRQVEQASKLITYAAVTSYLERVAQKVARNSDARFPISVYVIDSDSVDAVTLGGGYQYITRGLLLRLEGEGELASVLARGIAHTALRSTTREMTKSETMRLATIPIVIVPSGTAAPTANELALPIQMAVLKMKRDDELDADYFGVQYLYKAGYDTKSFTDSIRRISNTSVSAKLPNFSSLPPLDERLAALAKEISEIMPPRTGSTISTPEFDDFKERLRALHPAFIAESAK